MPFIFSKTGTMTSIKSGDVNLRTKIPGTVRYNRISGKVEIYIFDTEYGNVISIDPDDINTIDGAAPSEDIDTLLLQIIACLPDADQSTAKAAAITPHDSTNLPQATRGVYVGGAGNVVAIINGAAVTFTGVTAGSILPIQTTRINSTSTTATALVALY